MMIRLLRWGFCVLGVVLSVSGGLFPGRPAIAQSNVQYPVLVRSDGVVPLSFPAETCGPALETLPTLPKPPRLQVQAEQQFERLYIPGLVILQCLDYERLVRWGF